MICSRERASHGSALSAETLKNLSLIYFSFGGKGENIRAMGWIIPIIPIISIIPSFLLCFVGWRTHHHHHHHNHHPHNHHHHIIIIILNVIIVIIVITIIIINYSQNHSLHTISPILMQ